MSLNSYIQAVPKIELHVHLEGSIQPETLLKLAKHHGVPLPGETVEELRRWYTFKDFAHFIEIYMTLSSCLRTPDDIEWITREFLSGQAAQNILYSEVTYTPYNQYLSSGMNFHDQLAAINRARTWASQSMGVHMGLVIDISRQVSPDEGMITANWAIEGRKDGVVALGLGGPEIGNPPEKFKSAFDRAYSAGLPAVPHAGETVGPESIWGALNILHPVRIGHGVRCLEDPLLVEVLKRSAIPLEVCPTSNVCLKVVKDLNSHPLPCLLSEGLTITLNSDDPPMFNTTLTEEYLKSAEIFNFDAATINKFILTALDHSLLSQDEKTILIKKITDDFFRLERDHLSKEETKR